MKNSLFISLAFLLFAVACKEKMTSTTTSAPEEIAQENIFGAPIANLDAVKSFDEVSAMLDQADSVKTVLRARVSDVCQAKGCWMNITDMASGEEETIFVQFLDYGFFVPKDIAGREVIIEGVAYRDETSIEELKHFAEDAGKSAEEIAAITAPVVEKKFMASGVVLVP
jgi:hypothetical protein